MLGLGNVFKYMSVGTCITFVRQGSASDEKLCPLASAAAAKPRVQEGFTHSLATQPAGQADVSVLPLQNLPRGCRRVQHSITPSEPVHGVMIYDL